MGFREVPVSLFHRHGSPGANTILILCLVILNSLQAAVKNVLSNSATNLPLPVYKTRKGNICLNGSVTAMGIILFLSLLLLIVFNQFKHTKTNVTDY